MVKRRRSTITLTKVAVFCAAVTTILAMSASGVVFVTGGRNYAEQIHQLALIVMLAAYVFLIVAITAAKKNQPISLRVVEKDDCLLVSPCSVEAYAILDQYNIDKFVRNPHKDISKDRRNLLRIIIARDVIIAECFLDVLVLFPNLTVLDVQDSKVDLEFWSGLEELANLSDVLATNAIPDDVLRNISFSLPEVKFWTGKRRNLVVLSKAALNPSGV